MSDSLLQRVPHRRFNPLTREWILVSPHRTQRPWQGRVEKTAPANLPAYDPTCYLCPGNERAGGARNPKFTSTFVFENDYAALLPEAAPFEADEAGLLVARSERGRCRVICFSPRHDLTIPRMSLAEIREVIGVWAAEFRSLGEIDWVQHVQIFENRGTLMGASNPHPHCQIWANASLPNIPARGARDLPERWICRHRAILGRLAVRAAGSQQAPFRFARRTFRPGRGAPRGHPAPRHHSL